LGLKYGGGSGSLSWLSWLSWLRKLNRTTFGIEIKIRFSFTNKTKTT